MRPRRRSPPSPPALALVFGAAVGVGSAVGPVGTAAAPPAHGAATAGAATDGRGRDRAARPPGVGGLSVSQDGYTLQLAAHDPDPAGRPAPLAFADRRAGRASRSRPTRRRTTRSCTWSSSGATLTGFQHLHPDARRRRPLVGAADAAGSRARTRSFADFAPAARERRRSTLAADLPPPGTYAPQPLPAEQRARRPSTATRSRCDGELVAGRSSRLTLTVSRDGRPVTDLEPYLGAYGHLVALRAGDLAYLHVHPEGEAEPARPAAGGRLLRRRPDRRDLPAVPRLPARGVVRTAAFTAVAAQPDADAAPAQPHGDHSDDHAADPYRGGAMSAPTSTPTSTLDVELAITGMTCASCANRIERKLNKLDGVTATVNYATEKAKVTYPAGMCPRGAARGRRARPATPRGCRSRAAAAATAHRRGSWRTAADEARPVSAARAAAPRRRR